MTNSLRERRRQILHDEILDATRRILAEKGYMAMSMDDLASQVGISKPTLYSYFATKDDIVAATIVREIDHLLHMTEPGEFAGTPLERLSRILETVIKLQINDHREPIRMWMPEMHKIGCEHPEMIHAIHRLDSRLIDLIQEAIDGGQIDAVYSASIVVRVFYALVTAAVKIMPHSISGNEFDPNTAPQLIARMFSYGVRTTSD